MEVRPEEKRDPAVVTKFVFIRHGQTEWNLEGRCQGWLNSDLTAEGREGAIGVGKRLRAMHEKSADYRFDVVYSSPLGRAQDTAKLALHQFSEKDLGLLSEMKTDERLKERYYAELQGKVKAEFPSEFFSRRMDAKPTPEAESREDLLNRTLDFLNEKVEEHSGQTILVFSHAGLIGTLFTVSILDGIAPGLFPRSLRIPNCSINILHHCSESGKFAVKTAGDSDTSVIDLMESSLAPSLVSSPFSTFKSDYSTSSTLITPTVTSMSRLRETELSMLGSSNLNALLFASVVFGLGIWVGTRFVGRRM